MQSAEWIALFRQIPEAIQNKISLVLQNRTNISVDAIFRLEPSFVVLRGRLGGTTEGGLLFIVPYDQITNLCVNRELGEEEINAIFTVPAAAPIKAPSHQGASRSSIPGLRPSKQGTPPAPAPAAVSVAAKQAESPPVPQAPATAARNNLLERLRAARNAALPHGMNAKP